MRRAASHNSAMEYSLVTNPVFESLSAIAVLLRSSSRSLFSPLEIGLRPRIDAPERFHQVLHRIGHAEPQVALAVGSERRARESRHAGLIQQRISKRF